MKWQERVKNRENNRYKYKENPIFKSFPEEDNCNDSSGKIHTNMYIHISNCTHQAVVKQHFLNLQADMSGCYVYLKHHQ